MVFADLTSSKYYVFVGKSQPWTSEGATADSNPHAPVDSVAPESYYWDDMIALKVQSGNISFVVPRRDFSTSSAYDMYRHLYSVEQQLVVTTHQRQLHQVVQSMYLTQPFTL